MWYRVFIGVNRTRGGAFDRRVDAEAYADYLHATRPKERVVVLADPDMPRPSFAEAIAAAGIDDAAEVIKKQAAKRRRELRGDYRRYPAPGYVSVDAYVRWFCMQNNYKPEYK